MTKTKRQELSNREIVITVLNHEQAHSRIQTKSSSLGRNTCRRLNETKSNVKVYDSYLNRSSREEYMREKAL